MRILQHHLVMKTIFFATIVCLTPLFGNAQTLKYTIKPIQVVGKPRLQVTVQFTGADSGISYLNYQDNQFGEPNQMNFLVLGPQLPGVLIEKEPDSNRLVVRHKPGAYVSASYDILDLQREEPFYEYCCYKPIIKPGYFQIHSSHLLAAPAHYWDGPDDVQAVEVNWRDTPADWTIHSSFGPDKFQRVTLTNNQFGSAVFVGGDFRRYTFEVQGKPVYFVTRGAWTQFSDDTLTYLLQRTVEGHRAFWQDYSDSLYSVTFLPVDDAPWSDNSRFTSFGGSGLTNSFMSFATNNPGMNYDNIRYVYVHELMHRWIGIKIENAHEEQQYWFSEGFTEYFTLKNSLRYGLIDAEKFLAQLNEDFMADHYLSDNRAAPNDSLNYERFWNSGKQWEKLPYRRGCLYAFYLDNFLRKRSKGKTDLDEMMRHILRDMQQKPGQKLDQDYFRGVLQRFAGRKGVDDFNRYIERGEPIDFTKTPLPKGLQVKLADMPKYDKYAPPPKTKPEIVKGIPQFERKPGVSSEDLKAAILK